MSGVQQKPDYGIGVLRSTGAHIAENQRALHDQGQAPRLDYVP